MSLKVMWLGKKPCVTSRKVLQSNDMELIHRSGLQDAFCELDDVNPHLLILALDDESFEMGLTFSNSVYTDRPSIPLLISHPAKEVDTLMQCLRAGADDFLEWPIDPERLEMRLSRLAKNIKVSRRLLELEEQFKKADVDIDRKIIGDSPPMLKAKELLKKYGPIEAPVFIQGESGTGKSLIAQQIHARSNRAAKKLVSINCSIFSKTLIESELFGYVKGAFTGANRSKRGLFEEADGGTLFLDEIGEMPIELQPKLLRVLQDGKFRRVGSTDEQEVDVRIIAATNVDIEDAIGAGTFREDLYYRLNVLPLRMPALAERPTDIPLLAKTILRRQEDFLGMEQHEFSEGAVKAFLSYAWPGNIRELQNAVIRGLAVCESNEITERDLPKSIRTQIEVQMSPSVSEDVFSARMGTLEDLKYAYFEFVLQQCEGNKSEAARILEVDRRTLYKYLSVSSSSD